MDWFTECSIEFEIKNPHTNMTDTMVIEKITSRAVTVMSPIFTDIIRLEKLQWLVV